MANANENLGPAEQILQAVLQHCDHAIHNRPGMVVPNNYLPMKVEWKPVIHRQEGDDTVVYELVKVGNKSTRVRRGIRQQNGQIKDDAGRIIGRYQPAGVFPEVATWLYRQIADVWKLNNEFAAKWASYMFTQDHRDFKVLLAAFMLVQSRKGDPVREGTDVLFYDDDFRDVGEAMFLLKSADMNAKQLLRVREVLNTPGVAQINRELGFSQSRRPFLGRWGKLVDRWLRYREENPRMLEGLVKVGFRKSVIELARQSGYKPTAPRFFEILRWKQVQAEDGHRTIAIGQELAEVESWANLTEEQICQKIVETRPGFKRIVGMLPKHIGVTRAVMAAAIEAGSLSDKDLIIATPTLEELGLLENADVKARWEAALKAAEDTRANNIATRVRSQSTKDKLQEASDNAVKKAVEAVSRGLRFHVLVDISGSMSGAIDAAKTYLSQFLQAFPVDRVHVAVFNTSAQEVQIKSATAAGINHAFKGFSAGGGTIHAAGVRLLAKYKPTAEEDLIIIVVGDQDEHGSFTTAVRNAGLNPVAFGFLNVGGNGAFGGRCVEATATEMGVPCLPIDQKIFSDPYAVPRTLRNLIAATPVGKTTVTARRTLVDQILEAKLLQKPVWATT